MRASMLEVLTLDFVRTARSKGLDETRVLTRHVLRNAMLPMVTLIGLQAGTDARRARWWWRASSPSRALAAGL
jgi:ABC-type dipeptide/oligopeptide/nickel transport system permease component